MTRSAYLVLRRQLLYDSSFQASLDELLAYCKRVPIDAVALFTLSQELYHPTTEALDKAREAVPYLDRAGQALRRAGIGFQVQLIGVMGHGDYGANKPGWATWQTMVGEDGAECAVCPCPRDRHYHEHLHQLIRIYASLKPDVLWLDDDFRMHNHKPVRYGCFCPDHLAEFSKRMGREYTREQLVEAVLRPGTQPTQERAAWFSLLGEDIEGLARIIQKEVAALSPDTRVADMVSGIDIASIEGRNWDKFLKHLCGPHRPLLRPPLGCYQEPTPEELILGITYTREMAYHLAKTVDIWPELENYPFTRFSKSLRTTFLQMVLCQVAGLNGITMNLYDMLGTPLAECTDTEKLLCQGRAFLNALAELVSKTKAERGIRLLSHQRQALHRRTDGLESGYGQLHAPQPWAVTLPLLGFSTTFDDARVVAMAGQKIDAYSDQEIEQMLRGGCLLDASAAVALVQRGYGSWIGIEATELIPGGCSGYLSEEIIDPSVVGGVTGRISAWLASGSKHRLLLRDGARVASQLLSAYGDPIPGLVLYENQAGGRVAVWAYDGTYGYWAQQNGLGKAFRNWKTHRMLEALIDWLGAGPTPLFVRGAANVLPWRRDGKEFLLLGLANLSADSLSQAELVLGDIPIEAKSWQLMRLGENGRTETVGRADVKWIGEKLEVVCELNLQYMEMAVLLLQPKL